MLRYFCDALIYLWDASTKWVHLRNFHSLTRIIAFLKGFPKWVLQGWYFRGRSQYNSKNELLLTLFWKTAFSLSLACPTTNFLETQSPLSWRSSIYTPDDWNNPHDQFEEFFQEFKKKTMLLDMSGWEAESQTLIVKQKY